MKYWCLIIFGLISCTPHMSIEKKNGIYILKGLKVKIQHAKEIEWEVGKEREEEVSQGLRVTIKGNTLDKEVRKTLLSKSGTDSLMFKFSRFQKGSIRTLGHVLVPYVMLPEEDWSFNIYFYYLSAAVSEYYRNQKCPAYDHRLKIDDFDYESGSGDKFNLFASNARAYNVAYAHFRDLPVLINSGKQMTGKYFIEVALYNEKKKKLFGRFHKIDANFEIEKEEKIEVTSCNGVRPERSKHPTTPYNKVRNLEIK